MRELKTISIENNNYHILKVESRGGILEIYFMWGKIDFCSVWQQEKSIWIRKNILLFRNSQWYQYNKITNHGVTQEETHWKNETGEVFIELPKNFSEVTNEIFKKISPNIT